MISKLMIYTLHNPQRLSDTPAFVNPEGFSLSQKTMAIFKLKSPWSSLD
jgi:hypothetical protein